MGAAGLFLGCPVAAAIWHVDNFWAIFCLIARSQLRFGMLIIFGRFFA